MSVCLLRPCSDFTVGQPPFFRHEPDLSKRKQWILVSHPPLGRWYLMLYLKVLAGYVKRQIITQGGKDASLRPKSAPPTRNGPGRWQRPPVEAEIQFLLVQHSEWLIRP
jgi:hypothetical protein